MSDIEYVALTEIEMLVICFIVLIGIMIVNHWRS